MTQESGFAAGAYGAPIWGGADPRGLLSQAARSIGVGTSVDQGWAPAAPSAVSPISMSGGFPDPAFLPVAALLEAMRAAAEEAPGEALRYGGNLGFEGLRHCLAQKSSREDGVEQSAANFLLTNGSSAAIDLVCRTFLDPGDAVAVEAPSFSGSMRTIRGNRGRVVPVATDRDGLDPDDVERVLAALDAEGTPAKLLYTMPDFHNPTGTYLSLPRRRQVLEIAARHHTLVLEDSAYSDLYFGDVPLPSLYALAGGEGVLRVGSFSKTIATGLRVGWLQAREDFVGLCNQMRLDMGGSPLIYRGLARFVASGQWEEHTAAMRSLYAEKCRVLAEALLDECEPFVRFQRPAGGYFLWLRCLEDTSAQAVVAAAAGEGLNCVAGHYFYPPPAGDDRHIRLAFTAAPMPALAEAARRLRAAFERVTG